MKNVLLLLLSLWYYFSVVSVNDIGQVLCSAQVFCWEECAREGGRVRERERISG